MLANTKQIRAVINQAIAQKNGRVVSTYTDVPAGKDVDETTKRYLGYYMLGRRESILPIVDEARKIAKRLGYTNPIRCVSTNIRTVAPKA
jgi:hypothetical protein